MGTVLCGDRGVADTALPVASVLGSRSARAADCEAVLLVNEAGGEQTERLWLRLVRGGL